MLITFTTITDVIAYVDECVPDHGLSDERVKNVFHECGIDYGMPMEADDPRLVALCDGVIDLATA